MNFHFQRLVEHVLSKFPLQRFCPSHVLCSLSLFTFGVTVFLYSSMFVVKIQPWFFVMNCSQRPVNFSTPHVSCNFSVSITSSWFQPANLAFQSKFPQCLCIPSDTCYPIVALEREK